jgi:hypothetical protein
MKRKLRAMTALSLPLLAGVSACHSYHVETIVENRTGEPVHLLEVDYPSASFGKNVLDAGLDFHYRIQVRGSGNLKIEYTAQNGRPVVIDGPALAEGEEGQVEVVLLPLGKAEFHSKLTPRR